ncbi:MAG: hypothetical protein KC469_11310 [Flavobacteriaceae bacterium]|nr:hypothetical protein [Flavobacteriaceae bacterium]
MRIEASTNVSKNSLPYFRVIFGSLMLLYFLPSWSWINDIPPAFFDPQVVSLAYLFNGILPDFFYISADITVIVLFVLIILGIRTRIALITMFILSAFFYSFTYSFGKIDHNTSFLIFTYLVLAFTNSGTDLAILKDKKLSKKTESLALILLSLIICFGFFSAGISKFIRWIDFDLSTSGFLSWFNTGYFLGDSEMLLAPYVFNIPVFILEILDYITPLFELSAVMFLLNGKKSWFIFLLIACIFHISTLLLLNIDFTLNILTYSIFLLTPLFNRCNFQSKKYHLRIRIFVYFILLIALIKIALVIIDEQVPFSNFLSISQNTTNYINLFLWIMTIGLSSYILKNPKSFGLKTN